MALDEFVENHLTMCDVEEESHSDGENRPLSMAEDQVSEDSTGNEDATHYEEHS